MDEQLKAQTLFRDIVQSIADANLHPDVVFSILVKLVTMHGMQRFDKEEYMTHIEYVWTFEKFFLPDSNEVH